MFFRRSRIQRHLPGSVLFNDGSIGAGAHKIFTGGFRPEHNVVLSAIITGDPAAILIGIAPAVIRQLVSVNGNGKDCQAEHGQQHDKK